MNKGRLTKLSKTNPKNNVRHYRESIGLSRTKFSRKAHISKDTLTAIELCYTADPTLRNKRLILDALNQLLESPITLDDLFPQGKNHITEKIINPERERS